LQLIIIVIKRRQYAPARRGVCLRRGLELRFPGPVDGGPLRFKDAGPREYKVPLNLRIGAIEVADRPRAGRADPAGNALVNLLTKEVATVPVAWRSTAFFFILFVVSERYHHKRRGGGKHEHLEQFNGKLPGRSPRPAWI